jgi:chemotaxis signal transduction protein
MRPSRASLVLVLRDSPAAILIDRIEGLTEIATLQALPEAFRGEERRWYRGLALLEDRVLPVVNPSGFLTDQELELLSASAGASLKAESTHVGEEGAAAR